MCVASPRNPPREFFHHQKPPPERSFALVRALSADWLAKRGRLALATPPTSAQVAWAEDKIARRNPPASASSLLGMFDLIRVPPFSPDHQFDRASRLNH